MSIPLGLLFANNPGFWRYALTLPGIHWTWLGGNLFLCAVLALLAGIWCFSGFVLAQWAGVKLNREEGLLVGAALGAVLTIMAATYLGWIGLLTRPWIWSWLICQAALSLLGYISWRKLPNPKNASQTDDDWASALLNGLCLWVAVHHILWALAPPIEHDSLAHHLPLAKHFLETGKLSGIAWMWHSQMPSAQEVLYAVGLGLGSDRLPGLAHSFCGFLAALSLRRFAKELFDVRTAHLAFAIFLTLPVFNARAGAADNDFILSWMVVMSAWCANRWGNNGRLHWLALTGVFSGCAAALKYHGLWWAVILGMLLPRFRAKSPHRLRDLFVYCAAAVPMALPWCLRSWLETGNPFWPFLQSVFAGSADSNFESSLLSSYRWQLSELPILLFQLPFSWDRFHQPAFLLLPLIVFLVLRGKLITAAPVWRALGPAAILYLIPCLGAHAFWRFALPVLPFLCLITAQGAQLCLSSGGAWMRWALFLAALPLLPALRQSQNNALFAAAGLRSSVYPDLAPKKAFLLRALDSYPVMDWANENLPSRSRILLFQDVRGYYLDRPYLWGDPLNQQLIRYSAFSAASELWQRLQELGVTHVLIHRGHPLYLPNPAYYKPLYVEWMETIFQGKAARLLYSQGDVALYGLTRVP